MAGVDAVTKRNLKAAAAVAAVAVAARAAQDSRSAKTATRPPRAQRLRLLPGPKKLRLQRLADAVADAAALAAMVPSVAVPKEPLRILRQRQRSAQRRW